MSARGYFAVGLCQPKDGKNIGSALRACHCFGAALLVVQWRDKVRYQTDPQKAWRHLPIIRTDDLQTCLPVNCEPVAVEIVEGAKSLPQFNHPERAFYVFGPEDGSIPPDVLAWCQRKVVIPSRYCLNLAAAVNVVLYDRIAKLEAKGAS